MDSNKKRRMQRQRSVLNDCMDSESDSSCDPRISEFTSLLGGRVLHSKKKQKEKKNYKVLTLRKRNLSENEALVNMTKNRRNNTENLYSTTDNGMTEIF